MIPARRRPDPFPKVHPIWEYQADPELSAVYADYKRAFQVPWVGVAALAFARHPNFFKRWWQAMSRLVESRIFTYLIPGLVVNVAFFRQQLLE